MSKITAAQVKELRQETGLPILECKKALEETGGDKAKAIELLRKRGMDVATKKAGREAAEGVIASYIHHNDRVGVLVEVNCETDFVARNEEFRAFVKDLCLQIASSSPVCVRRDELDPKLVESEKAIIAEQLGKIPEHAKEKAIEGKLKKSFYARTVLLDQLFVKEDSKTISDLLNELISKLRENIVIKRFVRYELGG